MTREDLARIRYNESRIGFDVTWGHKNVNEASRDYWRRAADAAAKALAVELEPAPPTDSRHKVIMDLLAGRMSKNLTEAISRAIVAAIDADKEMG
jgi:hypothetical protein